MAPITEMNISLHPNSLFGGITAVSIHVLNLGTSIESCSALRLGEAWFLLAMEYSTSNTRRRTSAALETEGSALGRIKQSINNNASHALKNVKSFVHTACLSHGHIT
jgi:hypothetical protein